MSNRDGLLANGKKRGKYKKGKLCPKCGKGHLSGCDKQYKEGHRKHVICPVCHDCNF